MTLLRDTRFLWFLFISIAVANLLLFGLTGYGAGEGTILMPLDDVYIHFQYARQMALGHPYQYNLSDPPTSGATSLLYPVLLAGGYLLGFQGLWLGAWAMLLGTAALIAAMWAVYRLCAALDVPMWLSLAVSVIFGMTGTMGWHFMSGMETGIVVALTLWVLVAVVEKRLTLFVVVGSLLTLMRPEGGILAASAAGTLFLRLWGDYGPQEKRGGKRWQLLWLAIPVLALGVQPLLNWVITGTTVATGNQAKSILATVPYDPIVIAGRIWDNFSRMWLELAAGYDLHEGRGWYLPLGVGVLGLLGMLTLFMRRGYRLVGLMLLGWFIAVIGAVSTLDNAFWHFKRYQMPLHALLYPMAAWALAYAMGRWQGAKYVVYGVVALCGIFAVGILVQFQAYHALNVSYVYQQPYQMALWLRENTHETDRVAVHDVGLMRYVGERETLDMVGLTTPGAAAYWRNGPGSVAEWLLNVRPDYIASYGRGHGYGLGLLEDTALYDNEVAAFEIADWRPEANVALAANRQAIYEVSWDWQVTSPYASMDFLCSASLYNGFPTRQPVYDLINVGDITSEAESGYSYESLVTNRYATEPRTFDTWSPRTASHRILTGTESFILQPNYSDERPLMLVTQVHAQYAGTLDIFVNDVLIGTRWIPEIPGAVVSISTLIPDEYVTEEIHIRIDPKLEDGLYQPVCHSLVAYYEQVTRASYPFADDTFVNDSIESLADFQGRAFSLVNANLNFNTEKELFISTNGRTYLAPHIAFYVPAFETEGDYLFFMHVYGNRESAPVAQQDEYFGGLPVGNWLPGMIFNYPLLIDVTDVPTGTYEVAIGFYNPQDPTDRLIPESDVYEVTPDGRLWLGEVEIE